MNIKIKSTELMVPNKEIAKQIFAESMGLEIVIDQNNQIAFELESGVQINCWIENPRHNQDSEYAMDISLLASENDIKEIYEKLANNKEFEGEVKLNSQNWSEDETQHVLVIKLPQTGSVIFVNSH